MPSTGSFSNTISRKNKTFLGVDSILYPKDAVKPAPALKKQRRAGLNLVTQGSATLDAAGQFRDLDGLKGFGKSGARVSAIMNEMNAKNLL